MKVNAKCGEALREWDKTKGKRYSSWKVRKTKKNLNSTNAWGKNRLTIKLPVEVSAPWICRTACILSSFLCQKLKRMVLKFPGDYEVCGKDRYPANIIEVNRRNIEWPSRNCYQFFFFTPNISMKILLTVHHTFLINFVLRIGVGSNDNPLLMFCFSHYLSTWYCTDIVRRNHVVVITGSERVKRVAVFLLERAKTSLAKPDQNNSGLPSTPNIKLILFIERKGDDKTKLSLTSTL